MVFGIRAATSNTLYQNNNQSQSRVDFAPLSHVIGGSTIGASFEGNPTPLETSFGRSRRRQPSSSNSMISSVTLNGWSYHGPVFDDKGNKLNWLLIRLKLLVSGLSRTPFKFIYYMFNSTFINHQHSLSYKISAVRSISEFITVNSINNFRHPKLSKEKSRNGCRLGLDTWADTGCTGKYDYVEEFIIGRQLRPWASHHLQGNFRTWPTHMWYMHMIMRMDQFYS